MKRKKKKKKKTKKKKKKKQKEENPHKLCCHVIDVWRLLNAASRAER